MKNLMLRLLILLWLSAISSQAWGGTWTANGFVYKPETGARGTEAKALFDSGVDRIDARLGKEIWVGDPKYGSTLPEAIASIDTSACILRVPAGTHTISDNLTIPANIALKVERGAILAVAPTKTLTINGPLEAGLYQIFSCSGTGKVVFAAGNTVCGYLEWWGGGTAAAAATNTAAAQQALGESGIYHISFMPAAYDFTPTTPWITADAGTKLVYSCGATLNNFHLIVSQDDFEWHSGYLNYDESSGNGQEGFSLTSGYRNHRFYNVDIDSQNEDCAWSGYEISSSDVIIDGGRIRTSIDGTDSGSSIQIFAGNNIWINRLNLKPNNGYATPDDAIGITDQTANGVSDIWITNCRVTEAYDIVGLGSRVKNYIKNVFVLNCTTTNCVTAIYIKNGTIGNKEGGLVQNVVVDGLVFVDEEGSFAQNIAYIVPGSGGTTNDGGTVQGVHFNNISARYRVTAPGSTVQAAFLIYPAGAATGLAEVDDVTIRNVQVYDIYEGSAGGGGDPGYPLYGGVYLRARTYGTLKNLVVENFYINGCHHEAFGHDDPLSGTLEGITVNNFTGKNVGTALSSSNYAFYCPVNISIKNLALQSSTTNKLFYAAGVINAETAIAYFGTTVAATDDNRTIFIAPCPCFIYDVAVVNASTVAANGTDYLSLKVYDAAANGMSSTFSTSATALTAFTKQSLTMVNPSATDNRWLVTDEVMYLAKTHANAGAATDEMQVRVKYVPIHPVN